MKLRLLVSCLSFRHRTSVSLVGHTHCLQSLIPLPFTEFQLEEHYWTHVEYHSMHGFGFHSNVVEEAISDLISGCGGMSHLKFRPFKPISDNHDIQLQII